MVWNAYLCVTLGSVHPLSVWGNVPGVDRAVFGGVGVCVEPEGVVFLFSVCSSLSVAGWGGESAFRPVRICVSVFGTCLCQPVVCVPACTWSCGQAFNFPGGLCV